MDEKLLEMFIREAILVEKKKKKGRRLALDNQLDDVETREVKAAIKRHDGNISAAAKDLGVKRTTLYYRLDRLNIDH